MRTKIHCYLEELRKSQDRLPPAQRRIIPSQSDFAEAAGVPRQVISKWLLRGYEAPLNKKYLGTMITLLRANGFDTKITDVIEYVPPETV